MTAVVEEIAIPDLSNPETFLPGVPHDAFDALRARPGLYWQPAARGTLTGGFWAVTRFEDVVAIESDPGTFSSNWGPFFPLIGKGMDENIMWNDPPRHGELRRAVARSFGPRVVANFDGWVRSIVTETLDAYVAQGGGDWVREVAAMIPARVMSRVIGVPLGEERQVVDWTLAVFAATQVPDGGKTFKSINDPIRDYMWRLRETKLRQPADDMATALAQAHERGEFGEMEYRSYTALLLLAGFETTHTAMAQSMRLMVEVPEIDDVARRSMAGGSINPLVEEFLRFITPAMDMARVAIRDVDFRGTAVKQGDCMQLYFAAANRDPAVFKEPHRFDPGRAEARNLAFGSGAHTCVGNALAKLEMRILFEEMHKRSLKLRLAGQPGRGKSTLINQLLHLPLAVA